MVNSNSLTHSMGKVIYTRRKLFGMTQDELAEKIGIGQQSLSRMEQGKIAPKFERLQIIAETLNCTVADLFRHPIGSTSEYTEKITDVLQTLTPIEQEFVVEHILKLIRILNNKK